MNTLFILGNGFDLGLGLKTSYSDYINSKEFQLLTKSSSECSSLAKWLYDQNNKNAWFDLETSIGDYYNRPNFSITEAEVKYVFPDLLKSVNDFILRIVNNCDIEFTDKRTLNLVEHFANQLISNNQFTIYTYNYTGEIILKKLVINHIRKKNRSLAINIDNKIPIISLHGNVLEKFNYQDPNIVLGTKASYIINDKAGFVKKTNQNPTVGLFNDTEFDKYNRFIIYGHSLGLMDAPDFESLFQYLIYNKDKKIDIFTKENNSEREKMNTRFAQLANRSEDEVKNFVKKYVNPNIEEVLSELSKRKYYIV